VGGVAGAAVSGLNAAVGAAEVGTGAAVTAADGEAAGNPVLWDEAVLKITSPATVAAAAAGISQRAMWRRGTRRTTSAER